jgi:hypothetical protein
VGDDEKRAPVAFQEPAEPFDRLGVEMVGRFVENEQVGLRDDGAAEGDAAFFTAGEVRYRRLGGRARELGDGGRDAAIEGPAVENVDPLLQLVMSPGVAGERFKFGNEIEHVARAFADVLDDVLFGVEREFLGQITNDESAPPCHGAGVGLQLFGEDAQKGRFARAVATDEPDAVALVNGESGAVEHDLVVVLNAKILSGEKTGGAGLSHDVNLNP